MGHVTTIKCEMCEGRGVLYHGHPDAIGTPTEPCERCNGHKRVPPVDKRVRRYLKAAGLCDGDLIGATVRVVVTKRVGSEYMPPYGECDVIVSLTDGRERVIDKYKGVERCTAHTRGFCERDAFNVRYREYVMPSELESVWTRLLGLSSITNTTKAA